MNSEKTKNKTKTYNSQDSHVVTHHTTNWPACGLSTAERTGSPVLHTLWSYVLRTSYENNILLFGLNCNNRHGLQYQTLSSAHSCCPFTPGQHVTLIVASQPKAKGPIGYHYVPQVPEIELIQDESTAKWCFHTKPRAQSSRFLARKASLYSATTSKVSPTA